MWKMRSGLTILLLLITAVLAADVRVTVEPNVVAVGERFTLWLSNDGRETPQLAGFPEIKGIRWFPNQQSSRSEIMNGRAASSVGYAGQALGEGEITIPALNVIIGRETVTTQPVRLEVVSAGKIAGRQRGQGTEVTLDEAVFADGRYLTGNRAVYIGEEIPVEITLYTMDGVRVQIAWPELNFDKVAFHDYKDQFSQNPRFAGLPTRNYTTRDNVRFVTQVFRSAIRPLGTGELKGNVEINTEVQIPNRNRRSSFWDDDFMGFGSARTVPHSVKFDFPPLMVKALPAVPAGASFLGLIGDWTLDYELAQTEFRAGDPFTLSLTVKGRGSLDNLNAPKLEFPGFRVYPPEIERKNGSASVKYVIIPLRPGEDALRIKTAVFDLNEEKYRMFDFERNINVLPSSGLIQGTSASQPVVEGAAVKLENALNAETDSVPRSNILYLKKAVSCPVSRPLYLNNLVWLLVLALGGPLVFAICEMRQLRRDRLNGDPAILRRRKALTARGRVRRILKKTPPEAISRAIQTEVVPMLNDYLGLPPGTTATELAEIVNDPELAECLRSSGSAGFMPGTAAMNHGELKNRIIKALKYVSLILCLLVPSGMAAMSEEEAAAFNAYDSGDFKAAADYFRSQVHPGKTSPGALYNLGNALCRDGRLGEALACYENAHLLAPRDTDIVENLNYVRRQLMQSECGQVSTPGELVLHLRDSLRPDNWLLVLAGAWSCFWLLAAFRRRLGFNRKLLMLILIGVSAIAAGAAIFTQQRGAYAGNQAVVLYNGTKLRSLPSEQSGKVERTLREGERVGIVESRRDWVLVRLENAEGWLKSGDMEVIR
jgi:tetratricopeptide (TPR) repeat protein